MYHHHHHYNHQFKDHHEDNICNSRLLALVARANAIITELHRLIKLVPSPYKYTSQDERVNARNEDRSILDDIIYDFSYFQDSQSHENKIEADLTLKRADEKFCDEFIDILTRFYLTFESVQRYSSDLNNFMIELEDELFVGQSLDGLLVDAESRQLLSEAYFLLGYMLITVDNNFEGSLRERLIVSYYRYSSYKSSPGSSLDETCNLMRSTGFRSMQQQLYRTSHVVQFQRPENYPENLFSRVGVNQSVISLLIAKIQSTDIYDQTVSAFPHPDHRSSALSRQASMLYVILYFCPFILNNQRARMREIADKFFYDNWVISLHMGELVNLIEAWEPYKAAKESLNQLIEADSVRTLINQNNLKFYRTSKHLNEYLKEGWLDEKSVLENHQQMVNQMREANVLLRWYMLHSQLHTDWQLRLSQSMYSLVIREAPNREILFKFIQDLSELEKKFTEIYHAVLSSKSRRIEECRLAAGETLNDLIDIMSDTKPMRWIQVGANSKLVSLLGEFASCLNNIDFEQLIARDSVINLINDIDIGQESYLSGKNLQIIQLFTDTKESLLLILKFISLTGDLKLSLHSISDFGYAWRIMDVTFTTYMQKMIKDNPFKVYCIESIFLKLASSFDLCLLRLRQNNSKDDLTSVTQYYSRQLISYMRDVLHIIPASILELVSSIISIQTKYFMYDMPAKISLDNLKDYSLPEQRFQMLELTHKISHYAESMLMMQNTTIGSIKINSKQLLEDGIRRELVKRMSDSIQATAQQSKISSTMTISQQAQCLLSTLKRLDTIMNGYKCSFNYLQDYLFIYGLRMWQEELGRIIKFNVELASESLMGKWCSRDKGGCQGPSFSNHGSIYQSLNAPVPIYNSDPSESSFMMIILNEILKVTDGRATIYDEQMNAWYDQKAPHDKIVDLELFELFASSLNITGLNGIDQMCCVLIMVELEKLDSHLISINLNQSNPLMSHQNIEQTLISLCNFKNTETRSGLADKSKQLLEKTLSSAIVKMVPHNERLVSHLLRLGQLQAIRSSISCVLSTRCRYEARDIYSCLETLNTTLLSVIRDKLSSQPPGERLNQDGREANFIAASVESKSSSEDWELDGDPETSSNKDGNYNTDLEDSQLIVELSNHLEWIGLTEPLGKIYTSALQVSGSSKANEFRKQLVAVDLIFLVLLDQCSKFQFSRLISGFVPKQTRSFYETPHNVDGQPLFYGILTLLNHYEPFLAIDEKSERNNKKPLKRLLNLMSLFVRWSLAGGDGGGGGGGNLPGSQAAKSHEFSGETANMVLSLLELIRLTRQPADELLSDICLPKFVFDTFQFTACHLKQ